MEPQRIPANSTRTMRFSVDVEADPSTAWALISDIQRHGEWSPQEFEARKLDDGPMW